MERLDNIQYAQKVVDNLHYFVQHFIAKVLTLGHVGCIMYLDSNSTTHSHKEVKQ